MKQNIFIDLIRSFFFMIDKAVYALVEGIYNVFHEIAGTGILGTESFEKFTTRIYLLLGIFALFKIAFSLIGMFMNPDSFSDPKSGGGKLVGRVVKSLLLIVFVPTIFQLGYRLQAIVIDNNILPTIILGASTNPEKTKTTFSNAGRNMATTVFKAFFKPYPSYVKEDGTMDFKTCTDCKIYVDENAAVSQFDPILNETLNKNYIFDYNVLISLIAGGAVAFLLFTFAFDIAVRSVKLGFMQLIAPIPIIMSIDPKKGEEGLKKWISTTTSTYLDLFMRLVLIYFIVYILAEITKNGGAMFTLFKYDASGNPVASDVGLFAGVFIIIGLLLFATQAPNLIYDLLGIKPPSGGFGLNPLKKLAPLGKGAGILGGGLFGAAGGAFLRGKAAADKNQKLGSVLKQATFGAFGGGYSGIKNGFKANGKGSPFEPGVSAAANQYGRYLKTKDTTLGGRFDSWMKNKTGQKTTFENFEKQGKDLDTYASLIKNLDVIASQQQPVIQIQQQITALQNNPRLAGSATLQAQLTKLKDDLNKEKEVALTHISTTSGDPYHELVTNAQKEIDSLVSRNSSELSFKNIEDSSTAFGKLSEMSNLASVNKATIEVNPDYKRAKKEHELSVNSKKDKSS